MKYLNKKLIIILFTSLFVMGLDGSAVANDGLVPSGPYKNSCEMAYAKGGSGYVACQGSSSTLSYANYLHVWTYWIYLGAPFYNCNGVLHPYSCTINAKLYPKGSWLQSCMPVVYHPNTKTLIAACKSSDDVVFGTNYPKVIENTVLNVTLSSTCSNEDGHLKCTNKSLTD